MSPNCSHEASASTRRGTWLGCRGIRLGVILVAMAAASLALPSVRAQPAAAAGTAWHVSMTGLDTNPGTALLPFRTVQRGVDAAGPGDSILIHGGTYPGGVLITKSGTSTQRITIQPAGDGSVTLSTDYPAEPCDRTGPTPHRTIQVFAGADYWTIQGLNIIGGIYVFGYNANAAQDYMDKLRMAHNWKDRRSLPGRGVNDPVAARSTLAALGQRLGVTFNPSDGLRIVNNTITRRGILIAEARYGLLQGNRVGPIDCGIGAGIWINTFSDGWTVTGNYVHHVAVSTYRHYMQEGIRLGSASDYNTIEHNLATDLLGDGRGITTDVDPSWNVIRYNRAERVNIGFNDEQSGWGNLWAYNTVDDYRGAAFNFRALDVNMPQPSLNSATYRAIVTCNRAQNGPTAMYAGALVQSTFANNYFQRVMLGYHLRQYWTAQGNRWNGSSAPPSLHPNLPPSSAC